MLSDNKFRNPLNYSVIDLKREREVSAGGGEFNVDTWFSGPTGAFTRSMSFQLERNSFLN